jgi:hypothetical protein
VVAFVGTVAVAAVSLDTLKPAADTPLNETAVAPVKPEPARATLEPMEPEVGESEEMDGLDMRKLLV